VFSTITILPTANMRRTYEGIGIYVDDWSFALNFLMNFELGVLFFNKKSTILNSTYEGMGMFVDNWKKNPISLLGGHGNQKNSLLSSHKRVGVNTKVAKCFRSLLVNLLTTQ
jgi:hypothetical protein